MSGPQPGEGQPHPRPTEIEQHESTENTPLLRRTSASDDESSPREERTTSASSLLRRLQGFGTKSRSSKRRWPSIVALSVLCVSAVVILVLGFFTPEIIEEYAQQAVVFEPTSLSVTDYTGDGVVARVQGQFAMDASRVHKSAVRNLGRFGTWIAREVESKETEVQVLLPEYDNMLLGTAHVPGIKVNVRNGHVNYVDFETLLVAGPVDNIRRIANDLVEGRLGDVLIRGDASIPLKSGLLSFGSQQISHSILLSGDKVPEIPKYDIKRITVHEVDMPEGGKGLQAEATLRIHNKYPVDVQVPGLSFSMLVDNCGPSQPRIMLADASTAPLHIAPKTPVVVNVTGLVRHLPEEFLETCPGSQVSPLDLLLGDYIHGEDARIYVKGSSNPSDDTPQWISDLLSSVTVPVLVPGRAPENLIKNFTLDNVHFSLPDLFAEPNSPAAQPRISATVKALIGLPKEINFPVDVDKVRSNASIIYKHRQLGILDLHKWQKASATPVDDKSSNSTDLLIESAVNEAPLIITDEDLFEEVIEALLLGSKPLNLAVKATVDVDMITALGQFVVRKIPAEGDVPVKAIDGGGKGKFGSVRPKAGDLQIVSTTPSTIVMTAKVNMTNPTKYSASIPYASIDLLVNKTLLGQVSIRNASIVSGQNYDVPIKATWSPYDLSGDEGVRVAETLLSSIISGLNTSLTFRTSEGTIPALPLLGRALSNLTISLPTPSFSKPRDPNSDPDDDDDEDDRPHFIKQAIMHLWSSTAEFVLQSPFQHTTLVISHINATAMYHADVVGTMLYDDPIEVPPGLTTSPRLPVAWDLGSVGYDAVRRALGGNLHLNASADVDLAIGMYTASVWMKGRGIGTKIRV